jgi:hypothetical protein
MPGSLLQFRFVLQVWMISIVAIGAGGDLLAQDLPPVLDTTRIYEPLVLGAPWLVHEGDDPAFAKADFDDSQWTRFDSRQSVTTIFPNSRPAVLWYRIHVKVNPAQTGLALRELSISHAFEIYVNGERLITTGQVSPYKPYTMEARIVRRIPDRIIATGDLVIATRVAVSPIDWTGQNPGLYYSNLTLGQEETLQKEDWLAVIGENLLSWIDAGLLIGLGVVALVLYSGQRGQFEYLWIFAIGMIRLAEAPAHDISLFLNIDVFWRFLTAVAMVATPYVWVSLFFAFVQIRVGRKLGAFLFVAGLLNAYSNLQELVPFPSGGYGLLVNLPFVSMLAVVIPVVLGVHWKRGNREAGILLIPVLLFSLFIYADYVLTLLFQFPAWRDTALRGLNLIQRYPVGPFAVSLDNTSGILSTISLAIIMLLRSSRMSRRQAMLEGELAAAQQVQQVLVPEHTEAIPGFVIETAYQPAQQVGGDFFQILPSGGGVLLVVGDVAGKGLPAAMMVSLLVGSIRTAAEDSDDPQVLLGKLNERLVGRSSGAFSTAVAAHISPDGAVILANAGHLSPYLDGEEIELHPALPLGILSGAHYEKSYFQLAEGSRLTFYSDGVIEAQNAKGELFGFERGRELSTHPATEIVDSAIRFGQSDDITVVAISRSAAVASAA